MSRFVRKAILIFVVLLLAGCSSSIGVGLIERDGNTFTKASFITRTATKARKVKVTQAGQALAISWKVQARKGQITLRLLDPTQKVAWEKDFQKGSNAQGCATLTAEVAGDWILQISAQSARGHYLVRWGQSCSEQKSR